MEYKGRNVECALFENQTTDLQKAICTLFDAILNVKKSYLEFEEPEKKVWVSHLERVFAYELYHQWSRILKREKLYGKDKYVLNAEVNKNMNYFGYTDEGVKYPDMVLHHSQGNNKSQGIICEIKRNENLNNKSFREDIEKLEHFVREETIYGFAFGVFILVGNCIDDIYKKVSASKKGLFGLRNTTGTIICQKKIVCIAYDGQGISVSNLYNMIRSSRKHHKCLYSAKRYYSKLIIENVSD